MEKHKQLVDKWWYENVLYPSQQQLVVCIIPDIANVITLYCNGVPELGDNCYGFLANGKRHGPWIFWHLPSFDISLSDMYDNGDLHGECTIYNDNDQHTILARSIYEHGQIIKLVEEYSPDSVLVFETDPSNSE
jgi:hypothetical protein